MTDAVSRRGLPGVFPTQWCPTCNCSSEVLNPRLRFGLLSINKLINCFAS